MQSFTTVQHNKYLLAFAVVALNFLTNNVNSVTLDEFKHTLKIVHDTCQTITKVPEDAINQVRGDDFVENKDMKCYVHCTLEMLHLLDGVMGQFHVAGRHTDYMIPNELFETTIQAFGHCEGITNAMSDNCEAGYTMLKCFRENNKQFWLP